MNLIFKGLCPICHAQIEHDDYNALLDERYFCPNNCYQLYIDSETTMHAVISIPYYILLYFWENDKVVATEIIDESGNEILSLTTLFPINWKNLDETVKKIKSLIIFT